MSGSTLLIKNGTIVTATDFYVGDVLVEGERISTIGTSLDVPADRVIDAAGKYVLPGGIDVHTHLDMPFGGTTSADDFESGTIAAAHGGTTTIVDFAIQYRGQTLHHAWETWMKKAEGKAAIDYGFHMIVTELTDQVELEMDALVRQGVTSFKLFMAYPGVFMLDDASIFKALQRTGKNGGTICMHAENGGVIDVLVKQALAEGKTAPKYHALTRPARAEAEATHRAIALAEIADVPIYIVHLSAAEALEMVTEARDRGLPAFAETCPQYLFLSYDNYEEPGFDGAKYVMSPPLRAQATQDRLWRGLAFNDLQAISTDRRIVFSGSKMTMSASEPGAIVPLRGNSPKIFAGDVDVSSTKRFSGMRPSRTPNVYSICRRFSIPGPPFGIFEKSSFPSVFCPFQLNGQWSVETTERIPVERACQRCSWFSFARGGGV